jgi:YVTN family beta-propeller protein
MTGPKRSHVRRAISFLALAAVVAIVAVAVIDAVRTDDAGQTPRAATIPAVPSAQSASLDVVSSIAVERPAGIAVAAGSVWVASSTSAALLRIDPRRDVVLEEIALEGRPGVVTAAGNRLYVANEGRRELLVVDAADGRVERTLPLPTVLVGIAFAGGDAWVPDLAGSSVARLDTDDGSVLERVFVPTPTAIAADGESVWVVNRQAREVVQIDPATNAVVATVELDDAPGEIAVGAGAVWVSHPVERALTRIDPETAQVVARLELEPGVEPLFFVPADDSLWVLSLTRIVKIDPATNQVGAVGNLELGRHPGPEPYVAGGLAVSDGVAWVADTYGGAVVHFAATPAR